MTRQVWLVFYGRTLRRGFGAATVGRQRRRRGRRGPPTRRGRAARVAVDHVRSRSSCSRRSSIVGGAPRPAVHATQRSTCSTAGSNPFRGRADVAVVVRRRVRCSRRSRSSSRVVGIVVGPSVYRNGLDRRRRRPDVDARSAASPSVLAERVLPRHRARPLRERSGHRVRARSSPTASTGTVIDGAVNGIGDACARGGGGGLRRRPDRARAQLRARHRARRGAAPVCSWRRG